MCPPGNCSGTQSHLKGLLRWRREFFSARDAVDVRKATRWTKIVKGSGKQAKRAVKEAVGKLTGDAKLKAEGKTDKTARKPPRTQPVVYCAADGPGAVRRL